MKRLTVTAAEKAFLDEAIVIAERAAGKPLSHAQKTIVLRRARGQILAQRDAERVRSQREAERHERTFIWKRATPFRR